MSRWLFAGGAPVGLLVLGSLAGSPAIHSPGDTDCSAFEDSTTDEPIHGTHESDMYAEEDGEYADCPIDDGIAMGGSTVTT